MVVAQWGSVSVGRAMVDRVVGRGAWELVWGGQRALAGSIWRRNEALRRRNEALTCQQWRVKHRLARSRSLLLYFTVAGGGRVLQ